MNNADDLKSLNVDDGMIVTRGDAEVFVVGSGLEYKF